MRTSAVRLQLRSGVAALKLLPQTSPLVCFSVIIGDQKPSSDAAATAAEQTSLALAALRQEAVYSSESQ